MKTLFNKNLIGLIAACTALLGLSVGCADRNPIDPPEPLTQVGITTQIAAQSYAADQWSKITVDDEKKTTLFTDKDEIGVYLVEYNMANSEKPEDGQMSLLATGNQTDNHKYTYDGTNWTAANLTNPLTWRKFNAFAYHPYSAGVTSALAIKHTVRPDQSDGIKAGDYLMWCGRSAAVTPIKGEKFTLKFTHQLTRLIIDVSLPESYNGETIKSVKSVKTIGFHTGTTLNLLDGKTISDEAKGNVLMARTSTENNGRKGKFEALVVPSTIAAYQPVAQIYYTTESDAEGTLYYYAPAGTVESPGITFAKNQIYTLTLTANELIFLPELAPFAANAAPAQTTQVIVSDTKLEWSLKSNDTWIKFSTDGGTTYQRELTKQTGSPTVHVSVDNNTTGQTRLGSLSLSSTGLTTRPLVVRQN